MGRPAGPPGRCRRAAQPAHGVRRARRRATNFRDAGGCWGFLELWRIGETFRREELHLLEDALEPVTAALRWCHAASFAGRGAELTTTEPAVLLLSSDLVVRHQTPASEAYLRSLLPTEEERRPVPAAAYNVAAQLLAVEAGVDDHPAWSRVSLRPGQWLTLRAARLQGEAGAAPDGDIAVTIERSSPSERLGMFALVHHLTQRENDVLRCSAEGMDTRAVAARLFLSEYTVQDHLKAVFDKTGIRSRRELLARAVG